jgi:hypothetical protein
MPEGTPVSASQSAINPFDSPSVCPLCDKIFESPLVLACGHALCSPCVETQKAFSVLKNMSATDESDEHIPIECPTCKFTTLIDHETSLSRYYIDTTVPCFNPKCTNTATCECLTCVKTCCDECFDKLHALTGEHEKSAIGTTEEYNCHRHDQVFEFYCDTCLKSLCAECVLTHDRSHALTSKKKIMKATNKLQVNKTTIEGAISVIESTATMLDEQVQQAIQKIHQDYESTLQAIQMRREEALSQVEKTRHINLVSTQKHAEKMRQIISHIERLESNGTSVIRKWDIINRLQSQLSHIPLTPKVVQSHNRFTNHCFGVISAPIVEFSQVMSALVISWERYTDATNYRLRMILKSEQKSQITYKVNNTLAAIPVFADSSYGHEGIIIYEGPAMKYTLSHIQHYDSYSFSVECIDKNGTSYLSPVSEPLELKPPKVEMTVTQYSDHILINTFGFSDTSYSYNLRWKSIDEPSKIISYTRDNVGKYHIATQVIGKYYQYQINCSGKLGALIPSSFSLPILCTQAALYGYVQNNNVESIKEKIDIFEYLGRCNVKVKVTSSSQQGYFPVQMVFEQIISQQEAFFTTLPDVNGPWLQFDFQPYSVCIYSLNIPNIRGTLEGSNDGGVNWDFIVDFGRFVGGLFGGLREEMFIVDNPKFYSLVRIKAADNSSITIQSDLRFYGTVRLPFALSNSFGQALHRAVLWNKFTDMSVGFDESAEEEKFQDDKQEQLVFNSGVPAQPSFAFGSVEHPSFTFHFE